jgi:hypothetical protein
MKNFKDFLLKESAQSWSVKDLIFGEVARTYVHIPLSLPMWKRITEIKNMYGVHSTTVNGMEKLAKLQGSSAQISTVDWASKYGIETLASGVATDGGVSIPYFDAQSTVDICAELPCNFANFSIPFTVVECTPYIFFISVIRFHIGSDNGI